jgi:RNA polymerase sigma-70 factor (ECF subfamily)
MMLESKNDRSPSDWELVRRAKTGYVFASEILAERHRSMVFSVAYRALGNHDDASDVTQEALVYAHQRLSELHDPDKFAAWLRHITLSLGADYRRRRKTSRLGVPLTVWNADWWLAEEGGT